MASEPAAGLADEPKEKRIQAGWRRPRRSSDSTQKPADLGATGGSCRSYACRLQEREG